MATDSEQFDCCIPAGRCKSVKGIHFHGEIK
jgi:hypothetical protein